MRQKILKHTEMFEKGTLYPQQRFVVLICSFQKVEKVFRKSQNSKYKSLTKLPEAAICFGI